MLKQFHELLPPGMPVAVTARSGGSLDLRVDVPAGTVPIDEALARLVVKNGWDLLALARERASLEDVFRRLTRAIEPEAAHA